MKLIMLLACFIALFMGQILARTLYIHFTEFMPAVDEWHKAHERNDLQGMRVAYDKEVKAHERSFDPLWFTH